MISLATLFPLGPGPAAEGPAADARGVPGRVRQRRPRLAQPPGSELVPQEPDRQPLVQHDGFGLLTTPGFRTRRRTARTGSGRRPGVGTPRHRRSPSPTTRSCARTSPACYPDSDRRRSTYRGAVRRRVRLAPRRPQPDRQRHQRERLRPPADHQSSSHLHGNPVASRPPTSSRSRRTTSPCSRRSSRPKTSSSRTPRGSTATPTTPGRQITSPARSSPTCRRGTPVNDWRFSWFFTGPQTDSSNGTIFDGDIVVCENRPFGIDAAIAAVRRQQLPGRAARRWSRRSWATAATPDPPSTSATAARRPTGPSCSAGRRRMPDPDVRVGGWIADVTYERTPAGGGTAPVHRHLSRPALLLVPGRQADRPGSRPGFAGDPGDTGLPADDRLGRRPRCGP